MSDEDQQPLTHAELAQLRALLRLLDLARRSTGVDPTPTKPLRPRREPPPEAYADVQARRRKRANGA